MDDTPSKAPVRRAWWIAGAAAGLVVVVFTIWFFAGHKVWTDGANLRVSEHDAKLREVLWNKPQPLDGFASDEQSYEPSLSPDGTELYFVRGKAGKNADIYVSYRRDNDWTKPAPLDAVNSSYDDLGPRMTADGKYLLFYSNRPGGFGGYDIWASARAKDGWSKPFNLGPGVNSEFNEFSPDPTPDGKRLIFATNRKSASREQKEAWQSTIRESVSSNYDLWIAELDELGSATASVQEASFATTQPTSQPTTQPITPPAPLPQLTYRPAHEIPGVNTEYTEGASCMSPAGDFLYFASNRPGGFGKFDIYRCRVHGDTFGTVENVGPAINTADNEADPSLSLNGFRMYFSSDRPGADGRYQLLFADSREVYVDRQARALPHFGLSAWLLIISALVLIPLLLFLRGWDDHRLSILQKCLLLSLLVHAIITFCLSFVAVTREVTHYVRQEMGIEVAVNLTQPEEVEESLAIRNTVSNDLPGPSGAPTPIAPTRVQSAPNEDAAGPIDVQPSVGRLAPGAMTVEARPVHQAPLPPEGEQVAPDAAAAQNELGPIPVIPAPKAIQQAEAQQHVNTPQANIQRAASDMTAPAAPQAVQAPAAPAAKVAAGSTPSLQPTAKPAAPVSAEAPIRPDESMATGAAPVPAPHAPGEKVAAAERPAPVANVQAPSLNRAPSPAGAGPAPAPRDPAQTIPGQDASAVAGSIAAPAAAHANPQIAPSDVPAPVAGTSGPAAPQVIVASSGARQHASEPTLQTGPASAAMAKTNVGETAGTPSARPADVGSSAGPIAQNVKAGEVSAAQVHNDARSALADAAMKSAVVPSAPPTGAASLPVTGPASQGSKIAAAENPVASTAGQAAALARSAVGDHAGPAPAEVAAASQVPGSQAVAATSSLGKASAGPRATPDLPEGNLPGPVASSGGPAGPEVKVAMAGVRQHAAEPKLNSGAAVAALPKDRLGSGAASNVSGGKPGEVQAPAGPVVQGTGKPTEVALAGPRNHSQAAVDAIAAGSSPQAAAAVSGPQVDGSAIKSGGPGRQHVAEKVLAAGAAPTTRPSQFAAAGGGPDAVGAKAELIGGSAAPTAQPSESTVAIATGPAGPRTVEIGGGTAAVQATVDAGTAKAIDVTGTPAGMTNTKIAARPDKSSGTGTTGAVIAGALGKPGTETPASVATQIAAGQGPAFSGTGQSLASTPAVGSARAALKTAGAADLVSPDAAGSAENAPRVSGPKMANAGGPTRAGSGKNEKAVTADAVAVNIRTAKGGAELGGPDGIKVGASPVQANDQMPAGGNNAVTAGARLARTDVVEAGIGPDASLAPLMDIAGPKTPFLRSPEMRKPLLEKLGGTKQSEDAVGRGLAYLARMQEPDGRWTLVSDDGPAGKRAKGAHDSACTGFAILAFLAQDHTPDKPGPYREVTARAIDSLIAAQGPDGDLRGAQRGAGSGAGNMYDHGIATYALAEAGMMTHDPKIIDAALKGAAFIVAAQDTAGGGWRYAPKEPGDTSVVGWQIMALHSSEQVGFVIPRETREGAIRYIHSCEEGQHHLLAGYTPHAGAKRAMTAELLFCRMLMDQPLPEDGLKEVVEYLSQEPPTSGNANLYYWYYASLSMLQLQSPLWKDWNNRTRDALVTMQRKDGPAEGCWDRSTCPEWGDAGGRIFTTAMATLTLEVYYRYLPIKPRTPEAAEKR